MNRPAALPCPAPVAATLLSRLFPRRAAGGRTGRRLPRPRRYSGDCASSREDRAPARPPRSSIWPSCSASTQGYASRSRLRPARRPRACRDPLRDQLAGLPVAAEVKARLPAEAYTVHRLLGYRPGASRSAIIGASTLCPYDLVVVDEASMLDLALATKLVEALPDDGRLIPARRQGPVERRRSGDGVRESLRDARHERRDA